jgi:hypothetical protein
MYSRMILSEEHNTKSNIAHLYCLAMAEVIASVIQASTSKSTKHDTLGLSDFVLEAVRLDKVNNEKQYKTMILQSDLE